MKITFLWKIRSEMTKFSSDSHAQNNNIKKMKFNIAEELILHQITIIRIK